MKQFYTFLFLGISFLFLLPNCKKKSETPEKVETRPLRREDSIAANKMLELAKNRFHARQQNPEYRDQALFMFREYSEIFPRNPEMEIIKDMKNRLLRELDSIYQYWLLNLEQRSPNSQKLILDTLLLTFPNDDDPRNLWIRQKTLKIY